MMMEEVGNSSLTDWATDLTSFTNSSFSDVHLKAWVGVELATRCYWFDFDLVSSVQYVQSSEAKFLLGNLLDLVSILKIHLTYF